MIGQFWCVVVSLVVIYVDAFSVPSSRMISPGLIKRFSFSQKKSDSIFKEAQELMPGGVNSPVRSFKGLESGPIVFDKVKGAYAWDVDGNRYIDYVGSWGPAILGHADEGVLSAVRDALERGTSFGAPNERENVLAQMVIDAVPSVEMIRFTSSGTEACMSAMRVARAFTQREKFVKFSGCYHGHADHFLVQAGSGVATLGLPNSPGVTAGATKDTLVATYNDLSSVLALFEKEASSGGSGIAAVILEPVVGNAGFIAPTKEFLEGLRAITSKYGALLIFDEVMTGFRISYGGAQEYFGITPDMTTLGKVIGGGLPVGAFGGRADIMKMVAPAGPVYQAGTLSGNPLAMAAGIATLTALKKQKATGYDRLNELTQKLVYGIIKIGQKYGQNMCGGSLGGMFGLFFNPGPVNNYHDAQQSNQYKFSQWHKGMLQRGIYLAPSQFEAGFTSLAHSNADIEATLSAADEVLQRI